MEWEDDDDVKEKKTGQAKKKTEVVEEQRCVRWTKAERGRQQRKRNESSRGFWSRNNLLLPVWIKFFS